MDDKRSVIKRQVERGHHLDGEAREIYRIAILVVSIIVAAVAINFDIPSIIQTIVYDIGIAYSTDDSSLLVESFEYFGEWAILLSLFILSLVTIVFSLTFVMVVGFFFVPPYYAVRAQASAPISSNEHTFEVIAHDIAVFINSDPFIHLIPKRYRDEFPEVEKQRIVSDIGKEYEEYDQLDELIDHNKEVLFNKSKNLSRAKNSTQRFFTSMLIFSFVVIMMIYM